MAKNVVILILSTAALAACSRIEDISNQPPFDKTIGKSFVLQKDCSVVYAPLVEGYEERSRIIQERFEIYCEAPNPKARLVGSLKQGQIVEIIKVEKDVSMGTARSPNFHVRLVQKIENETPNQNGNDHVYRDMMTSAVTVANLKSLGDPPIFSFIYLQPLEKDGIWWK